jgi:hypothetical protein
MLCAVRLWLLLRPPLLPRQRRVSLRQAGEQLGSSHRRQAAVDAVDMQPQAAVLRAIPAISRSGSTAPVLVVPAVATFAIAGIPARRSRSIAAASASVRMRNASSTGMSRRLARPVTSRQRLRHRHVDLGGGIHRAGPGAVLVRWRLGLACHRQAHEVRR